MKPGEITELIPRHEFEAMIVPGFYLAVILLYFYPSSLSWTTPLVASAGTLIIFLASSYPLGFIVHELGKWIEKIFIEKFLNMDLKKLGRIPTIVGDSETQTLIKKYKLDINQIGYFSNLFCKKVPSEEKWAAIIRSKRNDLPEDVRKKANELNNHNKLWRGLLTDDLLLLILYCIKFGKYLQLGTSSYLIFLGCLIVVLIIALSAMHKFEKRELQIIYESK